MATATREAPKPAGGLVQLSLRVDPELKRLLKVRAAEEGRTMEETLASAIRRELARKPGRPPAPT